MTLTFGSLFAGIGGMDLGLERAGMRCAWQVEIDDFCQRVLSNRWPDVPKYRDVRDVGGHNLAPVDLICGGFPCQDISNAGKRAGIDGERSGLWSEYARIIRELRPRFVLVENVSALLARGLGRVLGHLAASGYDAEWDCIPAAAVGAPHRRDRLFLVAYAQRNGRRVQPESKSQRIHSAEPRNDGPHGAVAHAHGQRELQPQGLVEVIGRRLGDSHTQMAYAASTRQSLLFGSEARPELGRWRAACGGGWWDVEPDVGRVADGVPARVDRLRSLGNAVVPQVAEFIGRRIMGAA